PVSSATVREFGCDADIRLLTLRHHGEVLSLGRTRRLFSPAQRLALAVRDGGCIWPQCTAPPSWCDAHHVEWWQYGGATDVSSGALLCPAHHHLLHNNDFELRMEHGTPRLIPPRRLGLLKAEWRGGRSRIVGERAYVRSRLVSARAEHPDRQERSRGAPAQVPSCEPGAAR